MATWEKLNTEKKDYRRIRPWAREGTKATVPPTWVDAFWQEMETGRGHFGMLGLGGLCVWVPGPLGAVATGGSFRNHKRPKMLFLVYRWACVGPGMADCELGSY